MRDDRLLHALSGKTYHTYIGRPSDDSDPRDVPIGGWGWLGNPFETVEEFRAYFLDRLQTDRPFRLAVAAIQDSILGCTCDSPDDCHGQVIVETKLEAD